MASPLKNLSMRLLTSRSAVRCCAKSSTNCFTMSAPPSCLERLPLRTKSQSLAVPKSFARSNHSLSNPSRKPSSTTRASISKTLVRPSAFASSRTASTTAGASSSAAQSPPTTSAPLNWDNFFKLRLRRRRIQLLFSVTTGFVGGAAGAIILAEGFAEPLVAQIPLDPFVTLGLMTLACAGMGWLIGPTLGNQVFYVINRQFKAQMMQKESEFFARVKKHRVNPTNSSASNPVPDFYGEKIQSVSGYRRWLKDQRAFNKKKTASFV